MRCMLANSIPSSKRTALVLSDKYQLRDTVNKSSVSSTSKEHPTNLVLPQVAKGLLQDKAPILNRGDSIPEAS